MEELRQAQELAKSNPEQGISALRKLINADLPPDEVSRCKEAAILKLGEVLAENNKTQELLQLLQEIRPLFVSFNKAKTAKIVRALIDLSSKIPNSEELQIRLCEDSIQWCRDEKRTFLRQRLETKLAQLYCDSQRYKDALDTISPLLKEVKKLDDKLQLVEIQLIESKVYAKLENIPRSKASLTASRSCANAIYCPPVLQAEIDMMSGILNSEEKDYRTAYSYFYEAHEGFNSVEDSRALFALKNMLLSKIMCNRPEDVYILISSKAGTKYTGPQIEAMRCVAHALQMRSLHEFQQALNNFKQEIEGDPVVIRHVQALYDTMLEQHLIRIIEPFSKVELSHVAELIELPLEVVTGKLSQMILDKKFEGTLDQGIGCLIVYDEPPTSKLYESSLKYLDSLNLVMDSLFEKASQVKG